MAATRVDPEQATSNDRALRAILDHHAALTRELDSRVEDVLAAAREGADPDLARRALARFLVGELLPHAAAEEHTLYPAAAREPHAELLVRAMHDEHRALAGHVARLDTATHPTELAAVAAAIRALFGVHVAKENDYLLPVLARGEIDLAALLHDTHRLIAETRELDVRQEIPARRHELIFATYDALTPGESFVLVNDHDPKPLYYQFAAERAGQFSWDYLEQGPDVWRVRIGRITPS
jgi:uncharacterized protein (DUF2249 family)